MIGFFCNAIILLHAFKSIVLRRGSVTQEKWGTPSLWEDNASGPRRALSYRADLPHSFAHLISLQTDIPSWPAPPEMITGGTPFVLPLVKPASPHLPLPAPPASHTAGPQRTTSRQTSHRAGRQWSSRGGRKARDYDLWFKKPRAPLASPPGNPTHFKCFQHKLFPFRTLWLHPLENLGNKLYLLGTFLWSQI